MGNKHTPDISAPCINWEGALDADGYGRKQVGRKWRMAHRIAYERDVGPITDGLVIDHLCRNRKCVNPLHMEIVTSKENTLRGIGISAINHRKTHCLKGHLLGESRKCRICARRRWREYRLRKIKEGTWKKT